MNLLIPLNRLLRRRLNYVEWRVGALYKAIVISAVLFLLSGCGIENYLYIYPVSNVYTSQDGLVRFELPEDQEDIGSYFRGYRIYYKIYKSQILKEHNSNAYSEINSELLSHYNKFSQYVSGTDNAPVNIVNIFESEPRAYHVLDFEGAVNPLTGQSIHGITVEIDFNDELQDEPVLIAAGTKYPLRRSTAVIQIVPTNDRSFFYDNESFSGSDVEENENGDEFAYVALYILAIGVDDSMANAYSSPTFLGLLRLPDKGL